MMEMHSEACKRFMELLDGYMDGSLSEEELSFMHAHAAECETCAGQMKLTDEMKEYIVGLDDDVVVPLAAQNAWRQTVRSEARAKKRTIWARWASGIAAALVVVAGSAAMLRGSDVTMQADHDAQAATYRKIAMPHDKEYAGSVEDADWVFYEADGGNVFAAGDTEATVETGVSMMRSIVTEEAPEEEEESFDEVPAADYMAGKTAVLNSASMLVRSASAVVGTDDFELGCQNLRTLVEEYSGYFASEMVERTGNGAQRVSHSTIRVPMELADEFLTALENIADIHTLTIRNENVSEYYYDAESRLRSQTLIVERLNMLIATASGEEMLSLNRQLEDAYSRIDELERVLRAYQSDVRYATVELDMYEVSAQYGIPSANVVPTATKEPTLSERSASGFKQSLNKIGSFFESMIVSMAVIAPVVLIVAAVAGLVGGAIWCTKYQRKRNKKDECEKE